MARSLKKGPFVDDHLADKVKVAVDSKSRKVIKTWSRRYKIKHNFIGQTIALKKITKTYKY
ncbi:MAG: ribosomal protein S19 family protein, partial [Deltaproteobacteria bacterium]|nr:ribosomal protein S19 family protein [Deltaproteobacteria bacterium]